MLIGHQWKIIISTRFAFFGGIFIMLVQNHNANEALVPAVEFYSIKCTRNTNRKMICIPFRFLHRFSVRLWLRIASNTCIGSIASEWWLWARYHKTNLLHFYGAMFLPHSDNLHDTILSHVMTQSHEAVHVLLPSKSLTSINSIFPPGNKKLI